MSARFKPLGQYVYENGERIGCSVEEAAVELSRKLNAYQMRVERLKAENERLDNLCKKFSKQHSDISCENIMLRKAGEAMASSIQFNEEMAKDYNGPTIVHQCVKAWNAAKEGRPTE